MDGRAMPTIDTSSASRNRTPHSTMRVAHSERLQRSPVTERTGDEDVWSRSMGPRLHARACNAREYFDVDIVSHGGNIGGMAGRTTEAALTAQWHALLEKHARVSVALERALAEHDLGVSEFEVLA